MIPEEATDEELVRRARAGQEAALHRLLLRHQRLARARARSYFLAGAEPEDVVQEAMIGLYAAVRDFDPDRGVSFRAFAETCVVRHIVTAVRAASRHKHRPLNQYVPLHRPVSSADDGPTVAETVLAPFADPAEHLLFAERVRELDRHAGAALSGLEAEVMRLHLDGLGYQEIAAVVRRPAKTVDNALQRAKRKLAAHLAAAVSPPSGIRPIFFTSTWTRSPGRSHS